MNEYSLKARLEASRFKPEKCGKMFKGEVLKPHNPFESRFLYKCMLRYTINPYKGCACCCGYCYAFNLTKLCDILEPKPKKDFRKKLDRDIRRFLSCEHAKQWTYVSSYCDPLQPKLEMKYRDTLYTLEKLQEAGIPVILMTKFPHMLLNPEYLRIIEGWKELVIQPTIPCLDQLEPFATPTHARVKAVSELINFGHDIRVRIDPIVPPELGGQTEDTIYRHIGNLAEAGVKFTISKVVHKAVGVKKVYPDFYEKMDSYFKVNRSPESAFVLKDELRRKLLLPVYEACKLHGIKIALCSDGDLGLPGCLPCDGLC